MASLLPGFSTLSIVKPPRVLACALCQQRKVKCDRRSPCANCVKAQARCVPTATFGPRQRRRRFPERELLERLRHYEGLLQRNNIEFEPLHSTASSVKQNLPNVSRDGNLPPPNEEQLVQAVGLASPAPPTVTGKSETIYKAKNLWNAMYQKTEHSDDDDSDASPESLREAVVNEAWNQWHQSNNQLLQSNDHLMLGSRKAPVDLSNLHPEQGQIFKLWQIYLDNVNPVLKVTHTPTLQGRIIDAAGNLTTVKPSLTALMFSIYCVSIMSLEEEECVSTFGLSKEHLLTRYQFGCHQALLNNGFIRSNDRESLTAFFLYLVSIRPVTDPQSLSALLSLALRIAQRMDLHNQSAYAKWSPFEAEMRRRLWWSLILFDTRVCEMADYKGVMLIPTWDCQIPLNVNDFDLQPEMRESPTAQGHLTEALFTTMRSEMGEFIRHSAFYLDFTNPALKKVAKDFPGSPVAEGSELNNLELLINEKYLKYCNLENPLHFMTIWTARGYLAKNRLLETYSKVSRLPAPQTDAQRNTANSHALTMLECDTKLMAAPFINRYQWFTQFHFPFPAHMHLLQDLRMRPIGNHTQHCWDTISDAYDARVKLRGHKDSPFFRILAKIVLQAWESREAVCEGSENTLVPPRIVLDVRYKLAQPSPDVENVNADQAANDMGTHNTKSVRSLPAGNSGYAMHYDMGGQRYEGLVTGQGETSLDLDWSQIDWNVIDWDPMHGYRL